MAGTMATTGVNDVHHPLAQPVILFCPEHAATSQEFFRRLDQHGYLLKQTSEQLYCPKDRMFLADRYVLGTCHECGYEQARGDECPRCGQWLDPLKMPRTQCKVCGTVPERPEAV